MKELRSWIEDFPKSSGASLPAMLSAPVTQSFVNEVVKRAVDNPEGFAEDLEVHTLIRHRELRLKSKRARLAHRAALENWNRAPVGGQLDYRWPTTKRYLEDFVAARPTA